MQWIGLFLQKRRSKFAAPLQRRRDQEEVGLKEEEEVRRVEAASHLRLELRRRRRRQTQVDDENAKVAFIGEKT